MGVYMRVDDWQQATNTFTIEEFTSQEMQEWVSDYMPDLSALANVLPWEVYNAIEYQYNQITGGATFTDANPWDYWTITWDSWDVISSTSSPTITDMDNYPLVLCLPIDDTWNIIENTQYIYDNSNYDTEFPLTQYQAWNSLWAVAVDILTLT